MGTIFKRGRKWGISFADSCGKQVRKIISPYKETARQVLKKIETEMVEGSRDHNAQMATIPQEQLY